jgi:hypothetical protein
MNTQGVMALRKTKKACSERLSVQAFLPFHMPAMLAAREVV